MSLLILNCANREFGMKFYSRAVNPMNIYVDILVLKVTGFHHRTIQIAHCTLTSPA
jgi:hypothetical protein